MNKILKIVLLKFVGLILIGLAFGFLYKQPFDDFYINFVAYVVVVVIGLIMNDYAVEMGHVQ